MGVRIAVWVCAAGVAASSVYAQDAGRAARNKPNAAQQAGITKDNSRHFGDDPDDGGPMAKLSQRERFHWLTAPRSTMVQISSVRTGVCPPPECEADLQLKDDLKALVKTIVASLIDPIPAGHDGLVASCGC